MSSESLLDPKHTGGLYGGAGYAFEKSYILSQLPSWLASGLDSLQQELWSDVELFFNSGRRWLLQIKDHPLQLTEFRSIIEAFQRRDLAPGHTYEKFLIVSTGATRAVEEIRNALERWSDLQHLGESELADTKAQFAATLRKHGCEHVDGFIITSARRIECRLNAGWASEEETLRANFISALDYHYGVARETAETLYLHMARQLDAERGKLVDLRMLRERVEEARQPPETYSPQVNYRSEIAPLLSFYTDYYVGRLQDEQSIADLATQEAPGYVLIQAPPGRGKSALMYHLIKRYEEGRIPEWTVNTQPRLLYYFIRQNGLHNTAEAILRALNAQMLDLLHLGAPTPYTDLDRLLSEFNDLWSRLVTMTDSEQPLVLLIDGLDEMAPGRVAGAGLLPAHLGPYVHVVVTSRPTPDPRAQAPLEHPLRKATIRTLTTLGEADVEELLRAYRPWPVQSVLELAPRIAAITRGEPLFVRFVCREVIETGKTALARLEHDPPDDVRDYLRQQFHQLRDLARGDLVWDVLGVLTVTEGAIAAGELASVLGARKREVTQAIEPIKRFLTGDARFGLMPWQLREFVAREFSFEETRELRQRLVRWCEAYGEREWPRDTPGYVLLHYPRHLQVSGDSEGLCRLVQSCGWSRAKHVDTPWVGSLVDDLHSVSRSCADLGRPGDWPKAMSCQLRRALVDSLMSRLPAEAVVFMAKLGRVDQALDFAKRSWRAFQLFQQIAEVVTSSQPAAALEILQQSIHLFDRGTVENRYGARLVAAKKILENDTIRKAVPSSPDKAQDLVRQAHRIRASVPDLEAYAYEARYLCPILALTGQLSEAGELAESLPLTARSQAFRCISASLPLSHSQKVPLARKALSILAPAERTAETITREVEAVAQLLPLAESGGKETLLQRLVADERELRFSESPVMPSWPWVIENIAKVDLERAKELVFTSEWPTQWKHFGSVLIGQIAMASTQDALDTAETHYANTVTYGSILVDIIRSVAVERGEIAEAKKLISRYSAKLSGSLGQIREAYLALAEGYLAQCQTRRAEQVFDERVFVPDQEGTTRLWRDLLPALVQNSDQVYQLDLDRVFQLLGNLGDGHWYDGGRVLGHLAAHQGRIEMIDANRLRGRAQIGAALELATTDPSLARRLWEEQYLQSSASKHDSWKFSVDVRVAEAQEDLAKLDEFVECYEGGDPPNQHDMCANMVALPEALYRLREDGKLGAAQTRKIAEQVYAILEAWRCRRGEADCECYRRRDSTLSLLLSLMAREDYKRASDIAAALPPGPAKVMALKSILLSARPDDETIEQAIGAIQQAFAERVELANSYYNLACVLPPDSTEWIHRITQLADTLLGEQKGQLVPQHVRKNKAKAFIRLVDSPKRFAYVTRALDEVPGFLHSKIEVLEVLSEQALSWSADDRSALLWQLWELGTTQGETDVAALIVCGLRILESLVEDGKEEVFWGLCDEIDWAYRQLPRSCPS